MRPRMKTQSVSDLSLGNFLLGCMRLCDQSDKVSKEAMEMSKHTCAICGKREDEVWTCESCGARVCADHVVRIKIAEDDLNDFCVNCLEKD